MEMTKKKRARSTPQPFVMKTYMIVNDHSTDEVISWNQNGFSFIIWNPTEFAQNLLPKYFKHNNFTNFLGELNNYGFRKISNDRWEFINDLFQKGKQRLLYDIKKNQDKGIVMNFSISHPMIVDMQTANFSVSHPTVVDMETAKRFYEQPDLLTIWKLSQEVERLKKNIVELTAELKDEKDLNKNGVGSSQNNPILLSDNYHVGETSDEIPMEISRQEPISSVLLSENYHVGETSTAIPMEIPIEIPMEIENEVNPKLFGIYIGGKKIGEHENEVNPKLFGIYIGEKKTVEHVESKHYLEYYGELKLHRGGGGVGKLYQF